MRKAPSAFLFSTVALLTRQQFTSCDSNVEPRDRHAKGAADCHQPACASKMDMFKKSLQFNKQHSRNNSHGSEEASTEAAVASLPVQQPVAVVSPQLSTHGCPVDRDELGRSSWNLIHSVAAYYPDDPTEEQIQDTKSFYRSLSRLYPCSQCAPFFRKYVEDHPPRYSGYLCVCFTVIFLSFYLII